MSNITLEFVEDIQLTLPIVRAIRGDTGPIGLIGPIGPIGPIDTSAIEAHENATNPHPQYALISALGTAAATDSSDYATAAQGEKADTALQSSDIGTTTGTVAAGDDARLLAVANKVDKVAGKGLSTEDYSTAEKAKLADIAINANNYTHPANHPPSIITQDASNRFVTDTEKSTWNAKEPAITAGTTAQYRRGDKSWQPAADLPVSTAQAAAIVAATAIYTTEALGRAAVADGQAFKVQGSGDVAAYEYKRVSAGVSTLLATYPSSAPVARHEVFQNLLEAHTLEYAPSRNLYNPAGKDAGRYISVGGVIGVDAAWANSGPVPVAPDQVITLWANANKRVGCAFYDSAVETTGMVGTYFETDTGTTPLTLTAPSGATHFRFNVKSNSIVEPSEIMLELGAVKTSYEPWHDPYPMVRESALPDEIVALKAQVVRPYEESFTSPNLFNTANVVDGMYVANTGAIAAEAGWGYSGFIPVTAGESYTLQGVRGRIGLAFYTGPSSGALISGSFNGTAGSPLTVTAPPTATHIAFNLYTTSTPTYSNVMLALGVLQTRYYPFGLQQRVKIDAIYPEPAIAPTARLNLSSSSAAGSSSIQIPLGADSLVIQLSPFLAKTHAQSEVFNFAAEVFNGAGFRSNASDDVAPYRAFGTTIGANHGYIKTRCTVTAHGKSLLDVGSVWTDGTNQFVIVEVPDANTIIVSKRTTNAGFTGATLTHVSGATNTTTFTPSVKVHTQWYPVLKNRKFSISVDNEIIKNFDATYPFSKNVVFSESYEIMGKNSIVEWLITQVGTGTEIANYDGTSDISVSMSYVFDCLGSCVIYTDFLALNAVSFFQDLMFTQAYKMNDAVLGAVKYLVPKSLPFTQDAVNYDFSSPVAMTGFSVPNRLQFTPARCEAVGQLCDRVVQLNDSVGMAVGYLPVQDAAPAVRRTNASRKALEISEIAKIYMSCIDRSDKTSLAAGDYYSAVAYRSWFKRSAARTSSYFVRSQLGTYLYCDWHAASAADRIDLHPELHGQGFELVEKSTNVSLLSASATNSVVFAIADSLPAYAVLRFLN